MIKIIIVILLIILKEENVLLINIYKLRNQKQL